MSRPIIERPGERPRVVLTRRWPASVERVLAERFDVVFNEADEPLTREALGAALAGADALCPTVTDRIDGTLLGTGDVKVRLIANFGVGFNHIDVAEARERGITVTNTPGVLTDCTADLAVTLLLMVARRTGEGEREIRSGQWSGWRPTHLLGRKVAESTLGIVGAGRIGLATARRCHHGFRMRVLLNNPSPVAAGDIAELDARQCDLEELLETADFVSLHCPATPATRHLIDASRLGKMQQHALLINTARGDVVDESALVEALRTGAIGGAGLDVYEREPAITAGLLELPNVVLLPHLGSATEATRVAMGMCAVDNLSAFFAGAPVPNPV